MSGGDALPEGGTLFGADALPTDADADARPVGDAERGAPGDGAPGEVADDRLLARVFLTRVVEPGDETCGRWVRERGIGEVARRLREGGPALPGVSGKRWAGLCARASGADPRRDLAVARACGVRFVAPGTAVFHLQSPCCSRSCCVRGGPCCGAVAPVLGGRWRYTEVR